MEAAKGMKFHIFWGVVVEDKMSDSRFAKVFIRDFLPFFEGELGDHDGVERFTMEDMVSGEETIDLTTSTHTVCDWLGFSPNRAFPPDLVKGEQVMVFQVEDTELYYWLSMGRDDELRETEIHRIAVANRKGRVPLDDNNTYFLEFDTRFTKRIRLVLNNSDGETYSYALEFNGTSNFLSLHDNVGNQVTIESDIPRVKMQNSRGTLFDVNGDDIIAVAPGNIKMAALGNIIFKSKNFHREADQAIVDKSANHLIDTNQAIIDATMLAIDADMHLGGSFQSGPITASSYSTGYAPLDYDDITIGLDSTVGTVHNPPMSVPGSSGARHCAAEEQVSQMAVEIKRCLDEVGASNTQAVVDYANQSKMNKNTGE